MLLTLTRWSSTLGTCCCPRNPFGVVEALGRQRRLYHAQRLPCFSAYGTDMDQTAMMESDQLIAVDERDQVVPNNNFPLTKKEGHTFGPESPRGILHRAFSVFLFDNDNRLLLTQRATSKITFPNVWTNTCCSHPLHGMVPNEVDHDNDDYPSFPGIRQAAVRKLEHELGIPREWSTKYAAQNQMQFVTRFHYWAADAVTYGMGHPPWGEHEIDYVLFLQTTKDNPAPIRANPEEVSEYEYVTLPELQEMMSDDSSNDSLRLWSPWFRGILERGGYEWWDNLEATLDGRYTNRDITFFDPPSDFVASYNLPEHTRSTGVRSSQ